MLVEAEGKIEFEGHVVRMSGGESQNEALAGLVIALPVVRLGKIHRRLEVVWEEPLEHILVEIDGQLVLPFTNAQMSLVEQRLVHVGI